MNFQSLSRIRVQIKKILWITVAWIIISLLLFLSDYANFVFYNFYPEDFKISNYLLTIVVAGLVAGIVGGSVIVFFMENWLRTKPYGQALLYILFSYILISTMVNLLASFILFSAQNSSPFYSTSVLALVKEYFTSAVYIKGFVTWLIVLMGTIVVLLVNDKYGPGVFLDFLRGKYFRPRKEERIFMFLDLRSSTSIAEKLGEEIYFEFLKKLFADVTPSIIYSKGEIYQYVGDEIVISWKVTSGKQKANCIQCFFHIQNKLKMEKANYLQLFNVEPEFKAGLHYGKVVAGEIGVVKRDITFSGDVLNTAARIQNKCNEFGVNILFSKFLLDKLSLAPSDYSPIRIGELPLRGKQKSVILFTV
jgi:adenylate cyclase